MGSNGNFDLDLCDDLRVLMTTSKMDSSMPKDIAHRCMIPTYRHHARSAAIPLINTFQISTFICGAEFVAGRIASGGRYMIHWGKAA